MLRVKRLRVVALAVGIVAFGRPARADVASCLEAAEQAQPLRAAGELRQARARLVTCAAASCPRQVRADCTRWLAEVESALPSVVIQARESGGADVLDVTLSVDGVAQRGPVDGLAIAMDPGKHVLRIGALGREPVTQTVAIREGEKNRLVAIAFPKPVSVVPPPAPARPERFPGPTSGIAPVAWAVGGAGLLLAATGVVLWVQGIGERDDLRAKCGTAASCTQGNIDAARTRLIVGDVLVGAGALAVGAGVWLAVRSSSTTVSIGPGHLSLAQAF